MPDENDHLAFASAMIRKTNVAQIAAGVRVAGPEAIGKTLTLAMREAQTHALIAIAERLGRVVGALEPRDSVEVVGDLDQATQDKINRTLDMREAAERGAVPFTHVLADAFDLETERPSEEPARRRRTIVRDESASANFERGDALEDVVGLVTLEVDELKTIYGAQVAPALDRLQGGTGDPEEFAPAVINPVTDRAHGGCPECYVLEPFSANHVDGCVVGTIIERLNNSRQVLARMHSGNAGTFAIDNARKLDAIAKLCADREVEDIAGKPCDAREIWPSEIRTILRGEENPT